MTARNRAKATVETVTVDTPTIGRDEMNLAEFPISVLADRAPKGAKTLIFRDGNGKLTVTGSDHFGLPTALDADVIVALIQLTKLKNDFTQPTVNFTRYELLRLLGWQNEGKSYRRLDEALNRWIGVSLHYDGCWWDNRSKQYGDAKIHILESVLILDGKSRVGGADQQALPLSSFTWNKVFMESCQADNLKRLNVEAYFALEHPSSKRLYRFLDKRFYHRPEWSFDLREIAFERVGLSRNYGHNVAKIKEKLQPAIDELETRDFLEPMTREERFFKEGTEWKIRLHLRKVPPPLPAAENQPVYPPLVSELIARNVTTKTAAELVGEHPAEAIALKLEVFDWLAAKSDGRVAKSPAGYLVKSIADDFAIPKGFRSREQRRKEQEAKAAQEQRDGDARREDQKRKEADRIRLATEREEEQRIEAYWASLTADQQAELDAISMSQAKPEDLELERHRTTRRYGQRFRRHAYIRQVLGMASRVPEPA